ncbi:MAG: recombinase family protein [Lachnospiraceae bacterium]|nr:recombinase family protein [Lachnospiraceae bacterium]
MNKGKRVTKLIKTSPEARAEVPKKRVAAYCRVSTEMEIQESSLTVQMESFRTQIDSREDWKLVDVYADKGASGTSAEGRSDFLRMLADCREGKIDYIITKSISRFARNTAECLSIVRELKMYGVFVYFEKERLDTANSASEMVLSILAAIAQEESRSISENFKWSYRKRSEAGEAHWTAIYGYMKKNGETFVPDPETAPVVRRIFDEYYHGRSTTQIAEGLVRDGIPAKRGGKWTSAVLDRLLENEKYVGDVLCQKYYVTDLLSHKMVRNKGELPFYYISNHHEPIVDRSVFEAVKEIRSLKNLKNGSAQYPYFGRLCCPICGEKLVRSNVVVGDRFPAWHCPPEKGNAFCAGYYIKEKYVDRVLRQAYEELDIEALQKLASKEETEGDAFAALCMKEKMPVLEKVEYFFLHEMVGSIVFKKWDTAVVNWKCGLKSRVTVNYDKESDVPFSQKQVSVGVTRRWVEAAKEVAEAAAREKDAAEMAVREKDAGVMKEMLVAQDEESASGTSEKAGEMAPADALQ